MKESRKHSEAWEMVTQKGEERGIENIRSK